MYKILYSGCLLGKVWFVSIDKCIPRNIQFWQENHYLFFALRLAFLYPWSYLKVSSKHENQDELNGCSLVKHHSQVSSPLKLLARCAINVSALHGYFMCTWKVDTLLRIRKVSLLLFYVLSWYSKLLQLIEICEGCVFNYCMVKFCSNLSNISHSQIHNS